MIRRLIRRLYLRQVRSRIRPMARASLLARCMRLHSWFTDQPGSALR